jgi:hypothetical protein
MKKKQTMFRFPERDFKETQIFQHLSRLITAKSAASRAVSTGGARNETLGVELQEWQSA